jgi:hypothetical protein
MQRSKQHALMFLLGALLVGGVLGFSAERLFGCGAKPRSWGDREFMYNDLSLSAQQRVAMDSVLDERHRQIQALQDPIRPQMDSIRSNAEDQFRRILTPQQWDQFETRRKEEQARREAARAKREQRTR